MSDRADQLSHYFADEDTEAQRGQWLAEKQLVKQGQGKARTYFQASHVQAHVTYRRKLHDNNGRTIGQEGGKPPRGERSGDCLQE